MEHAHNHELFQHIRLIVGMVMSLAVARLLNGLAKFIQHPNKIKVYAVHICWVFSILLFLIHFWWWEYRLSEVQAWTFDGYVLIVLYAILYFLLCTLLFPDNMDDYSGYEDYFLSRRKWFFGILGTTFFVDIADTYLKGAAFVQTLGIEYPLRNAIYIALCMAAIFTRNKVFQLSFVGLSLVYEVSYIFRLYYTLN